MSSNQFVTFDANQQKLQTAIASSSGSGDASKIIQTDSTGRIDPSLMPVGIGADTQTVTASEALSAGDFVNVYDLTGSVRVRKADSSNSRRATGFVLSAVSNGANALVYRSGSNTALSGLTTGSAYFLSTTGSASTSTPSTSTGSGNTIQELGTAVNTTTIEFQPSVPIYVV
jgi:hypothetical protein